MTIREKIELQAYEYAMAFTNAAKYYGEAGNPAIKATHGVLMATVDALLAALEESERDAERYRKVRARRASDNPLVAMRLRDSSIIAGERLDQLLDGIPVLAAAAPPLFDKEDGA